MGIIFLSVLAAVGIVVVVMTIRDMDKMDAEMKADHERMEQIKAFVEYMEREHGWPHYDPDPETMGKVQR